MTTTTTRRRTGTTTRDGHHQSTPPPPPSPGGGHGPRAQRETPGGGTAGSVAWRVGGLFVPHYAPSLTAVAATMCVHAYLDAFVPGLYRTFVDEAVPQQDAPRLVSLALQMVVAMCVAMAAKALKEVLTSRVSEHLAQSLRERLFRHLQGLPLAYFVKDRSAEFAALFNHELTGATGGVCRVIFSTAQNLITLAFLLRAMWAMDWRLTAGCILLVPALYFPSLYMSSRMRRYKQELLEKKGEMNATLSESLTMAGVIFMRTFQQEGFFLDRFTKQSTGLSRIATRASILHTSFFQLLLFAMSFLSIFFYLFGVLVILIFSADRQITLKDGKLEGLGLSLGTITAFSSYIGRLYGPLSDLSGIHIQFSICAVSFERIFHYLDLKPLYTHHSDEAETKSTAPKICLTDTMGDVRFKNVYFSYSPETALPNMDSVSNSDTEENNSLERTSSREEEGKRNPWVLEGVSVHFKSGKVTAVVGTNGSGKTTLAHLLMGFITPQRGGIFIDGHPISCVIPTSCFSEGRGLAAHVGFLSQESYLIDDTVAVNLRLARPGVSLQELESICRVVGLHDTIASLPLGYDTTVGHRASCLSGGEKQKLAIARMLLRRPKMLVFDEFDSSLDALSRQRIHQYIRESFAAHTRIFITHRPETVQASDWVIVLEHGRVVRAGPPGSVSDLSSLLASPSGL